MEIRFRQANYLTGRFHRWHYWGFIEQYGHMTFVGPETSLSGIDDALENSEPFTGLHDRHGKEIYAGDRFAGSWGDGSIGYCHKCKSFEFFGDFDIGCMSCTGDIKWDEVVEDEGKLEVIGNIHEGDTSKATHTD